jgi:hypothetical protein
MYALKGGEVKYIGPEIHLHLPEHLDSYTAQHIKDILNDARPKPIPTQQRNDADDRLFYVENLLKEIRTRLAAKEVVTAYDADIIDKIHMYFNPLPE